MLKLVILIVKSNLILQILSCSTLSYYCYQPKRFKTHNKKHKHTNINDKKSCKISTVVEFQHLVLDSIQHNSKAESLNNRSAQQSSVGTLILKQNLWLFLYFYIFYEQNLDITACCNNNSNQWYELIWIKSYNYHYLYCYSYIIYYQNQIMASDSFPVFLTQLNSL